MQKFIPYTGKNDNEPPKNGYTPGGNGEKRGENTQNLGAGGQNYGPYSAQNVGGQGAGYGGKTVHGGGSGNGASGGMGSLAGLIQALATKYNGKSEDELLAAILAEAEKNRAAGTLTDADIDRFAAMLSPFLDEKKRKKLQYVVNRLKKK